MDKKTAVKIIEQNKQSYDKIAKSFDVSRKYKWPEFDLLKPYIKKGYKVLDIGCGNGRLYEFLRESSIDYVGIDQSEKLLKIAKKRYPKINFKLADVFNLPFKDKGFNAATAIAFLHHIPGEKLRLKVLKEVYRVLKPGGILFLTNWNLWQWNLIKKYKLRIADFFIRHKGLDAGDFWIDFEKTRRYYHHFTKNELTGLIKKAGFKIISCQKGKNMVTIACRN